MKEFTEREDVYKRQIVRSESGRLSVSRGRESLNQVMASGGSPRFTLQVTLTRSPNESSPKENGVMAGGTETDRYLRLSKQLTYAILLSDCSHILQNKLHMCSCEAHKLGFVKNIQY